MPETEFTKGTDTEHKVKLGSEFIYAGWRSGSAYIGYKAKFEVVTSLVGNGAPIKITGKSEDGKKLGKIKDKINNNVYVGEIEIPEDIETGDMVFLEVELSKNSIDGVSNSIPVYPPPDVKKMEWSAPEARRGDTIVLKADIEKVENGTEVLVTIYEYDDDGAHDKITELNGTIEDFKMEIPWEYEYHEDTDEIPTQEEIERYGGSYNPPEYFFVIDINGFKYGENQESGILKFKDYVELELVNAAGEPIPNIEYEITLPDGSKQDGQLDENGKARIDGIPPGVIEVKYKDLYPEVDMEDVDTDAEEEEPEVTEEEQHEHEIDQSITQTIEEEEGSEDEDQATQDDDVTDDFEADVYEEEEIVEQEDSTQSQTGSSPQSSD